MIFM